MSTNLNGIAAPVLDGVTRTPNRIGAINARSLDGAGLRSERRHKETWELVLAPVSASEGLAWSALLRGEGQVWSFDQSLYSSKGLGPASGTGAIVSTHARAGWGNVLLADAVTPPTFGSVLQSWTVLLWRWNGSAWQHEVRSSQGDQWLNGVLDTLDGGIVNDDGVTTIPAGEYADDLVILPFAIPESWPAQIYAANAPFGALPILTLTGDLGSASVVAKVESEKPIPMVLGGASTVGTQITATLEDI